MFRELIDAIQAGVKAEIIEKDGRSYSTKELELVPTRALATLGVQSLDSLIAYVGNQKDNIEPCFFVVTSPTKVNLVTAADEAGLRNTLVTAIADPPEFNFGRYYDQEEFRIALATIFVETKARNALLAAIAKIEAGSVKESEDDGFSQSAALRKSVRMVGRADLAPIQALKPYRTFAEIEQPESDFLLRLKDSDSGVKCALFEADGGGWKRTAREAIAAYLNTQKTGIPVLM